jgi:1,4-dihydroxy-2-naphthoate octaprenyltransferase
MLKRSTVQLLRFHFSFFLLPVYLFALSQVPDINWFKAMLIFVILHFLIYPASNGYNSYMDRDESSVGGIKNPLQPTRELFVVSVVFDAIAVLASLFIGVVFAIGVLFYILASRAYSYRGIRLKKFPVIGYLTVVVFQGAVTFWLVYTGSSQSTSLDAPSAAMIASSFLIGGFYPLTQIYQHEADKRDGVTTISYLLGYRGTFIFTAIVYSVAMGLLNWYFFQTNRTDQFIILLVCMVPVLIYFFIWAHKVWQNTSFADFTRTMRMNMLASLCTNLAFLILLMMNVIE